MGQAIDSFCFHSINHIYTEYIPVGTYIFTAVPLMNLRLGVKQTIRGGYYRFKEFCCKVPLASN